MRLGWTERVNLPDLGLFQVAAKIDTGARTSALHICSMRLLPRPAPPPARARRTASRTATSRPPAAVAAVPDQLLVVLADSSTIEVKVEDWVVVRDTSGRRERRPVVVTTLQLGRVRRTIRLGLTDRGDMRYPLLVGRTALPPGTLVDPNARHLLVAVTKRSRALRGMSIDPGAVRMGGKI